MASAAAAAADSGMVAPWASNKVAMVDMAAAWAAATTDSSTYPMFVVSENGVVRPPALTYYLRCPSFPTLSDGRI